jgi:glycosyltransferase involved in cell wall biosynthesis
MIVFIAPYSVVNRTHNQNLGATRKIEFLLALAARLGDVVLVNTLHDGASRAPREMRECRFSGARIREIALSHYSVRTVGKMLNLFEVQAVSRELHELGRPEIVWIYNAYAFEVMLARTLTRKFGARLVFQFDDWLLSRRLLHPKPLVDYLAWRHLLPKPSVCFAVNDHLAARENMRSGASVVLCPGVVSDELDAVCAARPPFDGPADHRPVVGYFGGLWTEKGADIVLDTIRQSKGRFTFHICGTGPLAGEFEKLGAAGENMHFHGRVDDSTLFDLISRCDVLLNVHVSIEKMGNGVFPFKVVEYVASGRLVLSTDLPAMGMREVREAIHFIPGNVDAILAALDDARELHASKHHAIHRARNATRDLLSAAALERCVAPLLSRLPAHSNTVVARKADTASANMF